AVMIITPYFVISLAIADNPVEKNFVKSKVWRFFEWFFKKYYPFFIKFLALYVEWDFSSRIYIKGFS
ncbi:hypothetical protein ACQH8C_24700, partial [Escherichia coli]|uniref:hypothetical protein n=1 Tax=Escherichia coli TaxID=562 RepID=UPI003CEAF6F7